MLRAFVGRSSEPAAPIRDSSKADFVDAGNSGSARSLGLRFKACGIVFALALIGGGLLTWVEFAEGQPQTRAKTPAAAPAAPATPAVAPATPEKINDQRAWTVACFSAARAAAPDCKIEQRLFAKETGRALSIATIEIPGATRKPVLLLHLPNALALQDGVAMSIDGGAVTPLLWQSCDGNGCYATLALTPALVESMKKGKVMAVRAVAANREQLTFQHLLTDFASAFEAAQ